MSVICGDSLTLSVSPCRRILDWSKPGLLSWLLQSVLQFHRWRRDLPVPQQEQRLGEDPGVANQQNISNTAHKTLWNSPYLPRLQVKMDIWSKETPGSWYSQFATGSKVRICLFYLKMHVYTTVHFAAFTMRAKGFLFQFPSFPT